MAGSKRTERSGKSKHRINYSGAAIERGAENRLGLVEQTSHAHVLCALPREKKCDARRIATSDARGAQAFYRATFAQCEKALAQLIMELARIVARCR